MMTRFQPFAPFPFERKMDINGASGRPAPAVVSARVDGHRLGIGITRAHTRTRTCVHVRLARLSSLVPQSGSRIDSSAWTCSADYTTSRLIIPGSKSIRIA